MIVHLSDVTFGYGGPQLLDGVDLTLDDGERVGLVGRNGAGKSTLMRLVLGDLTPLSGQVHRRPGARVATLPQRVPADLTGSVFHAVALGLSEWGRRLARYDELAHALERASTPALLDEFDRLQRAIENEGGYSREADVERAITQVGLDRDASVDDMSVGMKRRVLLARALVDEPDLLVLDEPTNHLDIEAIEWLEEFLRRRKGGLLLVTHDRAFLRALATRFVVVDRGRLKSYACGYETFLRRRDADLEAEEREAAEADKKLRQEEAWAKSGIKARRTRSQARLRDLEALRAARRDRRKQVGRARTDVTEANRSGQPGDGGARRHLRPTTPRARLVRDLTTEVMRGDKIALMGPNGSGKTTLLKLLLGELTPDRGTVRHGVHLEIEYFDQLQTTLDEGRTVAENLSEGDFVTVGKRRRHVVGYLEDFLFTRDQVRATVKNLSGGERNRLMLARVFTRPSNVLVLDEPTNDLDAETIELLEELLVRYEGTILFVSHDREFINHVATSTLVIEEGGAVGEYHGGYDDWLVQRKPVAVAEAPARRKASRPKPASTTDRKRLTYAEQLEAEKLPAKIQELESERDKLHEQMAAPGFYESDPDQIGRATERLKSVDAELEQTYERWMDLEERSG